MLAHSLLFVAVTAAAPPAEAAPRLEKGLEVKWTGTFAEASSRPGVRSARKYDVEMRMLVLDAKVDGADIALFTRIHLKPDPTKVEAPAGVVRIDLARVDGRGRVRVMPSSADPDNPDPKMTPWPLVQLQGLPVREAGLFVDFPDQPVKVGLSWTREEAGRPLVKWKVTAPQSDRGQPAFKVVASQNTDGYYGDKIRIGEWRRQDTLTIAPDRGYASRLERIVERRDPDSEDLSFSSILTLEQAGRIVYSGRLYEERREEAVNAAALTAMLDRLLAAGGKGGAEPFALLARRASTYLVDHAASDTVPYQEAAVAVKKRAESAARGNLPPAPVIEQVAAVSQPLEIGKPIADVTVEGITVAGQMKLSSLQGKAALVVYLQPTAASAEGVMRLVDELHDRPKGKVAVLSLGATGPAKKLAADLKVAVPMYDATDVYKTHALEATPVFIILDADGVVRHVARGWGRDTAAAVTKEYDRWAK